MKDREGARRRGGREGERREVYRGRRSGLMDPDPLVERRRTTRVRGEEARGWRRNVAGVGASASPSASPPPSPEEGGEREKEDGQSPNRAVKFGMFLSRRIRERRRERARDFPVTVE